MLRVLASARRWMTAEEIHDAVGADCSKRTTYRTLNNLVADHPIRRVEGRGNQRHRWRLEPVEPGSATMPLDPMQVLALSVGEDLLSPLRSSFLAQPLAQLHKELRAALTPSARAYADELRRTIAATHISAAHYGNPDVFTAIEEALSKEHLLLVDHGKSQHQLRRFRFAPYGSWLVPGRMYLVGRREGEDFERQLAVHRIYRAEVLDEAFDRNPAFDMASFTRRSFGVYRGETLDITIEFSAEVAHVARERILHESQEICELPDGAVRLCMRCAGLPEVAAWIAGFGGLARATAPEALVEAVASLHRGGLNLPEPDPEPERAPLAKTRGNARSQGRKLG